MPVNSEILQSSYKYKCDFHHNITVIMAMLVSENEKASPVTKAGFFY
ncbi:hypothetical protein JCM19237_1949 [Photobacterium aphoticum]|uniref:Uncharacterized protein n=1 Tax=Photobacterium aphoticum TaxID=754436 RepID=A0A090QWR3_9GAMM|nr:hypothetical protein JCM19237_1949 [Photobacterium aphoticum]